MLIVDVRTSDDGESIVLSPRGGEGASDIRAALRRALPDITVRSSASGPTLGAKYAHMLPAQLPEVSLRWSSEASRFVDNRRRTRDALPDVRARVGAAVAGGAKAAREALGDGSDLQVLDDHQWINVAAMTVPDGFGLCVFDEQGAGKTVTLIFAYDVLVSRDDVDFALIVAPKSMVAEWPRDFARFTGDRYRVSIATGSRRQKEEALASRPDVLVTNFETVVSMEDELRASVRAVAGRTMLVVDESFFIKNLDAQRTRALRRLREWCGRAFVLCGTPAPNSPHDIVQQFNLVDFGATFGSVDVPEDREAARPVVQRAMTESGLFVRHLKRDVLPDLPAKAFNRIFVPMEPVQASLYGDALAGFIRDLEAVDDQTFRRQITNFLARRAALLQICSHPRAIAPAYAETPAKLVALDEILRSLVVERREKVVLWSFYTTTIDALVGRYQHLGAVRYDGTVAETSARREAVEQFQTDDRTMLFIANPAAAGAGLTLHRARFAVYESFSNQAAHYLQSLDRIHRRGQAREVEYLILLCEGTIEINEYERLTDKELAAQDLLGDRPSIAPTRQSLLQEAVNALRTFGETSR